MAFLFPFLTNDAFVPSAGVVLGFAIPYIFQFVSGRLRRDIPSEWKAVVSFAISFVVASIPMVIAWVAKGQVSPDEFYQSVPVTYSTAVLFYEKFLKPRIETAPPAIFS